MSTSTLHFPSKEVIVSYLKQHPNTDEETHPFLTENKIIETVADHFADEDKNEIGVDMVVTLTLYDLNQSLKLSAVVLATIRKNLVIALKDCAAGREISVRKKDNMTSRL
jgi:hypothetical protein